MYGVENAMVEMTLTGGILLVGFMLGKWDTIHCERASERQRQQNNDD